MKVLKLGALMGLALSGSAWAVDFGVMETADTIRPKAFKLEAFPLVTQRARGDDQGAFAVNLGYGLPFNLDVEGQIARSNTATYWGSDLEWNAWREANMAFSIGGGGHTIDIDRGGTVNGLDTTAIFTYTPIHRLDLNAALTATYEDVNAGTFADPDLPQRYRVDNRFETAYFAPGAQYQVTRNLDVLGEVGLGLNHESDDYVGAGMSWYFR